MHLHTPGRSGTHEWEQCILQGRHMTLAYLYLYSTHPRQNNGVHAPRRTCAAQYICVLLNLNSLYVSR